MVPVDGTTGLCNFISSKLFFIYINNYYWCNLTPFSNFIFKTIFNFDYCIVASVYNYVLLAEMSRKRVNL